MIVNSIQSTDYRRNTTPSFTGATNIMQRMTFIDGKKDIVQILERRAGKNTRVGQLPGFVFERIEQTGIKELFPGHTLADIKLFGKKASFKEYKTKAIDEIMTTIEDCAEQIRNFKPGATAPIEEAKNRRPQAVVDRLKTVFTKYGLIDEPEKFNLKYLGEGEYKKAFRIDGMQDPKTGEQMCFKVFHLVDKTPEWHKYKCHGNYAEINIAAYWNKHVGPYTQRNKFYFGDIEKGYLVDRYVPLQNNFPLHEINEYDYGIKIVDEVKGAIGHNKIAGFSIDEGGSRVVNRIKNRSNTARYVLKEIKNTEEKNRYSKWYEILHKRNELDEVQKKAGLALSLKHIPEEFQEELILKCMDFNKPMVDQSLAYALKYLPEDRALKYFRALMQRKEPVTQEILMNEIPLLSKRLTLGAKYDDIDTARRDIDPDAIARYCSIAEKYVRPDVEEHLASYLHLMPKNMIIPQAKAMVRKGNEKIMDRLLHKAKFVENTQYSYNDKMEVIDMVKKHVPQDSFLNKKAEEVRIKLIRDSLDAE